MPEMPRSSPFTTPPLRPLRSPGHEERQAARSREARLVVLGQSGEKREDLGDLGGGGWNERVQKGAGSKMQGGFDPVGMLVVATGDGEEAANTNLDPEHKKKGKEKQEREILEDFIRGRVRTSPLAARGVAATKDALPAGSRKERGGREA